MAESKSKVESPEEKECDKELNELLDSALDGFQHIQTAMSKLGGTSDATKEADGKVEQTTSHKAGGGTSTSSTPEQSTPGRSGDEFSEQMAQQMEQAMKMFMEEDPSLMQQMQKLAQAAGNIGNTTESQQEFSSTLAQTLAGMSQNTSQLQDNVLEEHMAQAFSGMNMENDIDGVEPMMQDMMKSLLSKEVLYPSLTEMKEKYPIWLKENQAKVEKSKLEVYKRQYEIIQKICKEFESETATDSDNIKSKRFQMILDLMQQMQELGQPPEEIVGELAPGLKFDENGLPNLPGMPEGCVVM